jgi:hypothetical protein
VAGDVRRGPPTTWATREDASDEDLGAGAGRIAAMGARRSATREPWIQGAWTRRPGRSQAMGEGV